MLLLPKKISGFFEKNDCFKHIDTKIFKQICYGMVEKKQGKLLNIDSSLNRKNFYVAEIQFKNKKYYLLMNAYYSYIAFASSIENGIIRFIDKPDDCICGEYIILTLKELNMDYQMSIERLGKTELAQIKYWKPGNIGEIIFNFWD